MAHTLKQIHCFILIKGLTDLAGGNSGPMKANHLVSIIVMIYQHRLILCTQLLVWRSADRRAWRNGLVCLALSTCARLRESCKTNQIAALLINE